MAVKFFAAGLCALFMVALYYSAIYVAEEDKKCQKIKETNPDQYCSDYSKYLI